MPAVKRETSASPDSSPYQRKVKAESKPKISKANKPAPNGEGRSRLVEMVIERGIAAVMGANLAATQTEVRPQAA